ncbi:MAG: hypothetical protein U5S82_21560 [Gammaproteobacteria bacterium]|nr:hypothetical protein [Gammaproteobacteria bacterium]
MTPTAPVPVEDRGGGGRPSTATGAAEPAPPAEVEERGMPAERTGAAGDRFPAPQPAAPTSPAVVALLEQARDAEGQGRLDLSEANLERAVRIESRNPMIWHRLALIKLFRQQYPEAVAMAQRSNALAAGRPGLQRDNWRLIAQAEEARGRIPQAEEAAARARRVAP